MRQFHKPLGALLTILLAFGFAPIFAQSPEPEELDFAAEMEAYAQTHTPDETRAYAAARINEIANDMLEPESEQLLSEMLPHLGDIAKKPIDREMNGVGWLEDPFQCWRHKREGCRHTYNAEVFDAAAMVILGGLACGTFTGPGLAACLAAAYAAFLLMARAARDRRWACESNARAECNYY
jgi:hypothetical protein